MGFSSVNCIDIRQITTGDSLDFLLQESRVCNLIQINNSLQNSPHMSDIWTSNYYYTLTI